MISFKYATCCSQSPDELTASIAGSVGVHTNDPVIGMVVVELVLVVVEVTVPEVVVIEVDDNVELDVLLVVDDVTVCVVEVNVICLLYTSPSPRD